MQSEVLLAARVSVRYGDRPAVLRDVELKIRRGEVLGLVGQSGSGKSTLAMAILGLLERKNSRPEGTIDFDGCDLLTSRTEDCAGAAKSALVAESGTEDSHAIKRSVAGACRRIECQL